MMFVVGMLTLYSSLPAPAASSWTQRRERLDKQAGFYTYEWPVSSFETDKYRQAVVEELDLQRQNHLQASLRPQIPETAQAGV